MEIKYLEKHVANSEDIMLFEQVIGTKLPDDYKQFLLDKGGGELDGAFCFKMATPGKLNNRELSNWDGLGHLSSFDSNKIFDLPTHYKYMNSEEREFPYIPKEMIVIGGSGASCLLLGIKDKYKGQVFFWHSNLFHGDENGQETFDNISFVSESFDTFIISLFLDE